TTTSVLPVLLQYRGGYEVVLIPSTAPRYIFDMEWLGWKIHRYVGTHTRLHIAFRSSRHRLEVRHWSGSGHSSAVCSTGRFLTSTSALLLATGSPLRRAAMANSGSGSF